MKFSLRLSVEAMALLSDFAFFGWPWDFLRIPCWDEGVLGAFY